MGFDEEIWQKIHQSERESKEVKFTMDKDVEHFDDERRASIFMTDFDDDIDEDSDSESFADAEDKVILDEYMLPSKDGIEPKMRTIVHDTLVNMFKEKCDTCSKSDEIDQIVDDLVVNI